MNETWPLLQNLLHQGTLQYVDYALAQSVMSRLSEKKQTIAALLCYISAAARFGHMCVKITENTLEPCIEKIFSPQQRFGCDDTVDFSPEQLQLMRQHILQGAKECPKNLMSIKTGSYVPFHRQNERFYIQRNFFAETIILQEIQRLNSASPNFTLDCDVLRLELQLLIAQKVLLVEQSDAILYAAQHSLTFITGGPGTGKTYTVGILIKLLLKHITIETKHHFEVLLAAPTGKAAAQLQQSLHSSLKSDSYGCSIFSGTLQRLLSRLQWKQFSADIIVVDESSMIDASLFSRLLQAVKHGARIILLGDLYQLPPIESGNLFSDLLEWGQQTNPSPVITLSRCMRIESTPIAQLAEAIKQGQVGQAFEILENSHQSLHRLHFSMDGSASSFAMQKFLVHYVRSFFPTNAEQNPLQILQQYQNFRVLTPLRQGPLGVDALNLQILQSVQSNTTTGQSVVLPILITRNDESLELYNGDVGILYCKKYTYAKQSISAYGGEAFFFARHAKQKYILQDAKLRCIPSILLPHYELAYCLSVHKSQGSEFNHVVLLLPEGAELFGRQVLYTGVTRAKKKLDLFALDHTLQQTIEQQTTRLSGFLDRAAEHISFC